MRFLVELFATLLIALALGLSTAWYMVAAPRIGFGVGVWTAVPPVSAETADPYARARIARSGEIALGAGEGLVFFADHDEEGVPLDGRCDYRVVGGTPPARLWTLSVVDDAGALPAPVTGRTSLLSREILRDAHGRFEIVVAATARPGNWLPSHAAGAKRLIMRFYDTPLALSPDAGLRMPRVVKGACR
ncbi:MAG: DUF1214 domain-containing protein [Siculibacillus sp.]|nr:DUF1214 domain-containing protein [Siculibacillus sp.]